MTAVVHSKRPTDEEESNLQKYFIRDNPDITQFLSNVRVDDDPLGMSFPDSESTPLHRVIVISTFAANRALNRRVHHQFGDASCGLIKLIDGFANGFRVLTLPNQAEAVARRSNRSLLVTTKPSPG